MSESDQTSWKNDVSEMDIIINNSVIVISKVIKKYLMFISVTKSLTGVLSQCREAAREYIGGLDGFRRFFQRHENTFKLRVFIM